MQITNNIKIEFSLRNTLIASLCVVLAFDLIGLMTDELSHQHIKGDDGYKADLFYGWKMLKLKVHSKNEEGRTTTSTTIQSYGDIHSDLLCNNAPRPETNSLCDALKALNHAGSAFLGLTLTAMICICGGLVLMNTKVPMDDSIRYGAVVFCIVLGWIFSLASWCNWTDKSNGNDFSDKIDEAIKIIAPDVNAESSKIRISTSIAFVLIASFGNFFLIFLVGFMTVKREPLLKNDEEDFTTLEET